jgi:hypothetical protein
VNPERGASAIDATYTQPVTEIRGLVAYLPTGSLPRGRNVLSVKRRHGDPDREYFIPFWL